MGYTPRTIAGWTLALAVMASACTHGASDRDAVAATTGGPPPPSTLAPSSTSAPSSTETMAPTTEPPPSPARIIEVFQFPDELEGRVAGPVLLDPQSVEAERVRSAMAAQPGCATYATGRPVRSAGFPNPEVPMSDVIVSLYDLSSGIWDQSSAIDPAVADDYFGQCLEAGFRSFVPDMEVEVGGVVSVSPGSLRGALVSLVISSSQAGLPPTSSAFAAVSADGVLLTVDFASLDPDGIARVLDVLAARFDAARSDS